MVRRTRSFIINNYAQKDPLNQRKYLEISDRHRFYFPKRKPVTLAFSVQENSDIDQFAMLFSTKVVDTINGMRLPRYGLGNYRRQILSNSITNNDQKLLDNLSRAGRRLMGFCRTNLFKRLESSGHAFLLSVKRHIIRNFIFIHAVEHDLDIPIGSLDPEAFDDRFTDQEDSQVVTDVFSSIERELEIVSNDADGAFSEGQTALKQRAAVAYNMYVNELKKRFDWISPSYFEKALLDDLYSDTNDMLQILQLCGKWQSTADNKLHELRKLLSKRHPDEKVLIFSQFADTVNYLYSNLKEEFGEDIAYAHGDTADPTSIVQRFSPISNDVFQADATTNELRILVTTDILSEGQNLQDGHIIVNFDLPWAIIRLIQRAGRVDRIGQKSDTILCYTFLPADGVERIIHLRSRIRERLEQNREVVGTDEIFFEDEKHANTIRNLYHEKAGILDDEEDDEVDLASRAWQIWKNATENNKALKKTITSLPDVVYSAKEGPALSPSGVLVFVRTADSSSEISWVNEKGEIFSESQLAILKAAECSPETPAVPKAENHHELVECGVKHVVEEEKLIGGSLGSPRGTRFRLYEKLKEYEKEVKDTVFEYRQLSEVIEEVYQYPLLESSRDSLGRLIKSRATSMAIFERALFLYEDDRLCNKDKNHRSEEPRIICSLGLVNKE